MAANKLAEPATENRMFGQRSTERRQIDYLHITQQRYVDWGGSFSTKLVLQTIHHVIISFVFLPVSRILMLDPFLRLPGFDITSGEKRISQTSPRRQPSGKITVS